MECQSLLEFDLRLNCQRVCRSKGWRRVSEVWLHGLSILTRIFVFGLVGGAGPVTS
jgi:hypothetical protein